MKTGVRLFPLAVLCATLAGGAALGWSPASARQASAAKPAPPPPGRVALEKVCSGCHALDMVEAHRDTREGWDKVVAQMIQNGASPTPAERQQIVAYLARTQPPKP